MKNLVLVSALALGSFTSFAATPVIFHDGISEDIYHEVYQEEFTEIAHDEVYLVLGGFHLMKEEEERVNEVIGELQRLSVRKVAPSHCTGERAIEMFAEAWGDDFFSLGCGDTLHIDLSER